MPAFREEVHNVTLAGLISDYGLVANPETLKRGARPDVLIHMSGIKVIIEGRFGNEAELLRDTERRVAKGLADIALGLFYPPSLRSADTLDQLRAMMGKTRFEGTLCFIHSSGLRCDDVTDVGVPDLVEALNRIFALYVKNNVLRNQVEAVSEALETAVKDASETGLFFQSDTVLSKLKLTLGITRQESGST